jgi:hypothetical protein
MALIGSISTSKRSSFRLFAEKTRGLADLRGRYWLKIRVTRTGVVSFDNGDNELPEFIRSLRALLRLGESYRKSGRRSMLVDGEWMRAF